MDVYLICGKRFGGGPIWVVEVHKNKEKALLRIKQLNEWQIHVSIEYFLRTTFFIE